MRLVMRLPEVCAQRKASKATVPSFRSAQYLEEYPSADDSSLVPGQIGPSIAATASHRANSRTNVPDPRRNPPPVESAPYHSPSSVRAFRSPGSGTRPLNNDAGVGLDDPTTFVWSVGNGGAPTGSGNDVADTRAHLGFDPARGHVSDGMGIGNVDYGGFNSAIKKPFSDPQAHEVTLLTDKSDPRRGAATDQEEKRFETSEYEQVNSAGVIAQTNSQVVYDKPQEWFHRGRPARKIRTYDFARPFDQWAAHYMTGQKVLPSSPVSVGGQDITNTPHASTPLRTYREDEVPGDAYNGPYFPAPGMESVGPNRNTWRLQPQRWDELLINDPGVR